MLVEKRKGQLTYLGENNEKYITFSVSIEKEVTRIDKTKTRNHKSYILHITIYCERKIYGSSLSNLINIIVEGIHKIECKYGHNHKTFETCRIIFKNCY